MDYPVLKEFPHEIHTKRLLIRLPLPGDGKAVHEAIQFSQSELKQWLSFAQREQTLEETEANVREAQIQFLQREDLRFQIFDKHTKAFLGCTGLHRIDWKVPKFEIGYWVDTRQQGKGIISEAVEALTKFGFKDLGANRVEIRCDEENYRSRAIPEKLGFKLEGVHYHDSKSANGISLRNTCVYAKLKE
ncbi:MULTISPECIES: GNAT family N-acetyltransferase [Clostridia]|uniref:GNAT family N-acetyltransferase n=1 Tax=Clostridia TaxID=186801 RepID=UPI000EA205D0|nr:GNAT family N-acetyltransferase [Clostridium sp. 1xD42-85]NBJ71224.1 N-acetyltransferase [Roseburia sp. 1XD42-34]RKI74967.1 N-acetyltransferase [Clostridium sp. 1xD42-85]